MRAFKFPILLAASLAFSPPVFAESDLGKIATDIAKSLISQEADKTAYLNAQSQNSTAAYRDYLKKYPKGIYRGNAEQALAKLGAPVTAEKPSPTPTPNFDQSAAAVEAAIGLTRAQRVLIQRQLSAIGYSTGVADGLWGSNTRSAIGRWQKAQKLSPTGYVTVKQVNLIAQQSRIKPLPDSATQAKSDDPVEEGLLSLTYAERLDVQRRLTALGYSTKGIDGSFGLNTRRALASWQRDEGVRVTGYLTADQFRALRRDTGG